MAGHGNAATRIIQPLGTIPLYQCRIRRARPGACPSQRLHAGSPILVPLIPVQMSPQYREAPENAASSAPPGYAHHPRPADWTKPSRDTFSLIRGRQCRRRGKDRAGSFCVRISTERLLQSGEGTLRRVGCGKFHTRNPRNRRLSNKEVSNRHVLPVSCCHRRQFGAFRRPCVLTCSRLHGSHAFSTALSFAWIRVGGQSFPKRRMVLAGAAFSPWQEWP